MSDLSIDEAAEEAARQSEKIIALANAWMASALALAHDHPAILAAARVVTHRIRSHSDMPSEVLDAAETMAEAVVQMLDEFENERLH